MINLLFSKEFQSHITANMKMCVTGFSREILTVGQNQSHIHNQHSQIRTHLIMSSTT